MTNYKVTSINFKKVFTTNYELSTKTSFLFCGGIKDISSFYPSTDFRERFHLAF
jgi:hypothetical protein